MRKNNYLAINIGICLFLLLPTIGCWSRHELNTLAVVIGMGLDKIEETGKIQVTAQIFNPSKNKSTAKNKGDGGSSQSFWNLKNSGDNLLEVIQGLSHKSNQKIYLADNQVIIFSNAIAKEGVQKYIDFFARNNETRMNVWVLVAKNQASQVLTVSPELESTSAVQIAQLVDAQSETSEASRVNLEKFISRLMSKTDAAIAPIVEVTGEGDDKSLSVSGTAVFKKDKLVGQLNRTETRGLLWVLDEIKNGVIVVDSPSGDGKVSLLITRSKSEITPLIMDENIRFKIGIKEEGNIGYQSSQENLIKPPIIEELEKEQAAVIESEVIAALEKAKKLNVDIFCFGDLIHQQYPDEWLALKDRWDEVFPTIDLEFAIQAKLRRTGRIGSLAVPEKE